MFKLIVYLRPAARYLLIIWLLTIITVSSLPNIPTLKIHTAKAEFRLDYIMHFCEYGFLTFLTMLSFAGSEFNIKFLKAMLIALGLILFAVMDEYHQKFIPGRSFNLKDILSNLSGICVLTISTLVLFRLVKNDLKHKIK